VEPGTAPRADGLQPPGHEGRGLIWAIVASGPSAKRVDLDLLRGRASVIAIKQSYDLIPWADVVYGCDAAWWRARRGLPEFKGRKIVWAGSGFEGFPEIERVKITRSGREFGNEMTLEPGTIGGGGNSGFQAINLAIQFGARKIILIGFDMTGAHWYGRNRWPGACNPDEDRFAKWRRTLDATAPKIAALGVDVVNASPESALECFPKMTLAEALD
jgi:hypothetical protein